MAPAPEELEGPSPEGHEPTLAEPRHQPIGDTGDTDLAELPLERRGGVSRNYATGDPAWKDRFLELLGEGFSVQAAARAVGRSSRWCYQVRDAEADFAEKWNAAKTRRIDTLEESAWRRAIHGWEEPIFYQGVQVGSKRVYSTALTLFMLRAWKPEPYRKADIYLNGTASVEETARKLRESIREIDAALAEPETRVAQ